MLYKAMQVGKTGKKNVGIKDSDSHAMFNNS